LERKKENRRLIKAIIADMESFLNKSFKLNTFERLFPIETEKKQKIQSVMQELEQLKMVLQLGEVETGLGEVTSAYTNKTGTKKSEQTKAGFDLSSSYDKPLDFNLIPELFFQPECTK
jgi:hypothetical protein